MPSNAMRCAYLAALFLFAFAAVAVTADEGQVKMPKDYWEWRDADRYNCFYYGSMAFSAPRAMLLNAWKFHNAEAKQILDTDFDARFWVSWVLSPQLELARKAYPYTAQYGWIGWNFVLAQLAHGIAELLLFLVYLVRLGPKAALVAWAWHVIWMLLAGHFGVWFGMNVIWPFLPWWLCDFFNNCFLYVGGPFAMLTIPRILRDKAGVKGKDE